MIIKIAIYGIKFSRLFFINYFECVYFVRTTFIIHNKFKRQLNQEFENELQLNYIAYLNKARGLKLDAFANNVETLNINLNIPDIF